MKLYLDKNFLEVEEPAVMGILNLTPDSFSDGGRFTQFDSAISHAETMIRAGASIIDVGGESTRPGAVKISINEEIDRVLPVIERIKREFDTIVSIDTYKDHVAELAVKEGGADIVNDISALSYSIGMAEVVANLNVPVILMHIKGTPSDMQKDPFYLDVVGEIMEYFNERIGFAVSKGIKKEKMIIDPGIGFGKRFEDNIAIIKNLRKFKSLNLPVMVGLSKKTFLGVISGIEDPFEREVETITADLISAMNGASILRVHNVENCVRSLKVLKKLFYRGSGG
ncbi:MAG: dihydropteroate synthase [Candidatus Aminicenantes bacterium]|nr:dihydropteroate synthase [Candidatus Aminicenantes bacterium]